MPTDSSARPATAADVAARAGVSRATVSQILNGRTSRFPSDTQARVYAAAAAMDYRPSPAGRSLVTGRGSAVVVLMPRTTIGANIQDALEQVSADTMDANANVVFRFAGDTPDATADALLWLRPLAVVDLGALNATARSRLRGAGVIVAPDDRRSAVESLDELIAAAQLDALLSAGARRVIYAYPKDERGDPFSPRRFAALQQECGKRGLDSPTLVRVTLTPEGANRALAAELSGGPVGFACFNDVAAIALTLAAVRLGASIPRDIALVGLDASDVGQLISPRLTSVSVDVRGLMHARLEQVREALDLPIDNSQPQALISLLRGETT